MSGVQNLHQYTATLFREQAGKITAVLVRKFGMQQLELVQDAVQDAFASALNHWPKAMPEKPEAWLMRVASNELLNTLKRKQKQQSIDNSVFAGTLADNSKIDELLPGQIADSELRLLFACTQLDFPQRNRVMLTLHLMCGLGISELAATLFMQPEAVKKALQRMKAELRTKPGLLETAWPMLSVESVSRVQLILYLMFNEGCKTTHSNVVINHDLCFGAMRLTQLLCSRITAAREESYGLMALMFFALARFEARTDAQGDIVPLAQQDRDKWDKRYLAEGFNYLKKARNGKRFYLEALISSVHCAAPTFEQTNWSRLVFLYRELQHVNPSPVVELNMLLARSYAEEPAIVLDDMAKLRKHDVLSNSSLLIASEADVLDRAGHKKAAQKAFETAAAITRNLPEKRLYLKRAAQCT